MRDAVARTTARPVGRKMAREDYREGAPKGCHPPVTMRGLELNTRADSNGGSVLTRAAFDACYSDDKEHEIPIENQFRLCREHAERERWQLIGS